MVDKKTKKRYTVKYTKFTGRSLHMKKMISLTAVLLLICSLLAFAACGEGKEPNLPDTGESVVVTINESTLSAYADTVAKLNIKTAINNYSSASGAIDELYRKGAAIEKKINDEKITDLENLEAFRDAYKTVGGLWKDAEKAAAKYVKGFYAEYGKKDVTAVYCYMNVDYTSEFGNTYLFALTYLEGETPVNVYMKDVTTSDKVDVSVYKESPEKFYVTECENKMMNTVIYNNITLNLDNVLSDAK